MSSECGSVGDSIGIGPDDKDLSYGVLFYGQVKDGNEVSTSLERGSAGDSICVVPDDKD